MKYCRNAKEFCELNDKDLSSILFSKFRAIVMRKGLEDLKQELYARLHRKKYIENYRPFEIQINPDTFQWYIKPSAAKLSTYVTKFIYNYVLAYHKDATKDELCLSIEAFSDSNYNVKDRLVLRAQYVYDPTECVDKKIEMDLLEKTLKKKHSRCFGRTGKGNKSLYKLFSFYKKGLTDKDIAKEWNITIPGVGAMKRKLREVVSTLLDA